jgi:hypothetical protein
MSTAPVIGPVATTTAARFRKAAPPAAATAAVQGLYYLGMGVWPLVSLDTFLAATGPKTDLWLVQAFGILVGVIGFVLLVAAWRHKVPLETAALGVGVALALAGTHFAFVWRKDINPVYLLDALAELVLIAMWAAAVSRPPSAASA